MLGLDEALASARERFNALVASLQASPYLVSDFPTITFAPRAGAMTARVYKAHDEYHVELGDDFVVRLLTSIAALDERQLSSIASLERGEVQTAPDSDAVRAALYAVAEQFVLSHELFHVLCGHLDHRITRTGGSELALEEFAFEATSGAAAVAVAAETRADERDMSFYRELEADDTALQFLVAMCRIEGLAAVVPAVESEATLVLVPPGDDRRLAFRFLFAALWQVVSIFETVRGSNAESGRHPFPAARLMALLFTLMPYYLADDDATYELGERVKLTASATELAQDYMRSVVRPAMEFALSQISSDDLTGDAAGPDASDLFADTLLDLKALMFDEDVRTPAGRQVRRASEQRRDYRRALQPFRFVAVED